MGMTPLREARYLANRQVQKTKKNQNIKQA